MPNSLLNTPIHLCTQQSIAADHPALAGHFPGHPLVPGVVLLQRVEALIQQQLPEMTVQAVKQAKFLAAVLPDHLWQLEVTLTPMPSQTLQAPQAFSAAFTITLQPFSAQATLAASGQLHLTVNRRRNEVISG